MLGGYSIAFDLLSKEYGWTDDVIMELPIRTFRQKIAAINRRLYLQRREQIAMVSWQTRQLAQYIAAGYWVEGHNKAVDAAGMLAFDTIEAEQLKEAAKHAEDTKYDDFDPYDQGVPERMLDSLPNTDQVLGMMDPSRWRK